MSTPPTSTARRLAITSFKFAGVTTLGLLTGSTLSLTHLTAPSLLALSDHSAASSCLTTLRGRAARLHRRLHRTALGALALAYMTSPRGWRHPYLLWTALVAGVTAQYALPSSSSSADSTRSWWAPRHWRWMNGGVDAGGGSNGNGGPAKHLHSQPSGRTSPGTSSQEWEMEMGMSEAERAELGLGESAGAGAESDTNGEAVRLRVETWGRTMGRLATGYAVAGAMALVGLWGDGFAV